MLSITEIEQINQKLNPELALSLSLDNAKRMESSLLHSGFSPSTDMWKLILFYNGSLEEIKEMISFSFIPLLGNFAILFIKEKDIPKLAGYADKEANPLYPLPVLMDAKTLEQFYYKLMKDNTHENEV